MAHEIFLPVGDGIEISQVLLLLTTCLQMEELPFQESVEMKCLMHRVC